MSDPAVIAQYQPVREAAKPAECDHRDGCWVIDPYRGIVTRGNHTAPRCNACNGRIILTRRFGRGGATYAR
jgi:hypothetical protein